MARLYGRTCTIVVDDLRVTGLRVTFKVSKSLKKEPNTLDLKVYNLSADTRSRMQRTGAKVLLVAGYVDNAAVIFAGDARRIDHAPDGADMVTSIDCGDGEQAYRFARFSKSFAPGAPISEVITAASKALGINAGNLSEQLAAGPYQKDSRAFAHGYTAHGRASAELDRLLTAYGLSWSIQDGALQVLRGAQPAQGSAVLLTSTTGLVGSPSFTTPEKPGAPVRLRFKALLQPTIRCGGVIDVRSLTVRGQFRVESLSYAGDTHGSDWFTEGEATPL